MRQEIEIEFKNMLSEPDWIKICKHFNLEDDQFHKQTNFYYDTPDFQLKKHKSSLRIREREGNFEITLKEKSKMNVLESHIDLSFEEGTQIVRGNKDISSYAIKLIKHLKIDATKLCLYGSLETNRASFPYESGVLFLDKSNYFNHEDYELEYEVSDEKIGKREFLELLTGLDIPILPAKSKVRRFFESKNKS